MTRALEMNKKSNLTNLRSTKGFDQLAVGVRKQIEVERLLGNEVLVRFHRICRHPKNGHIQSSKFLFQVAEAETLLGAVSVHTLN